MSLKKPLLLPEPHNLRMGTGTWRVPVSGLIGIEDRSFVSAATAAKSGLARHDVAALVPGPVYSLCLRQNIRLAREEYTLRISGKGATVEAATSSGAYYGVQTFMQIIDQCPDDRVPCLTIKDAPDFADRGIYYDVCRGRVPHRERLEEMALMLSKYKINQLQLYIEHTFRFNAHPDIGRGASPLTAEDILALDECCGRHHIEFVPSLASFGHMSNVLRHGKYRHLAEDRGVGDYVVPGAKGRMRNLRGWTLTPGRKETYEFLDSLFAEFLPLFSSDRFNICCDETWDLGMGQSHDLCVRKGKGRVYLDHILRLRKLAARYGKRVMFWGDIIRQYPELIKEIPDDVTVLDWKYSPFHAFDTIRDFAKAGLPFYACPGTGSWWSIFPRLPGAMLNIHGFADAGKRHGAQGLLTTDWGDGGHYNFMEYSWPGFLTGAEQGWNAGADTGTFTQRFCRLFMKSCNSDLARALTVLGDIGQMQEKSNSSILQEVFFARPGNDVFRKPVVDGIVSANGSVRQARYRFGHDCGKRIARQLIRARAILERHMRDRSEDPAGLLPYWIFAADTMLHAARKLSVFGRGGTDTPRARRALREELQSLMRRFETLWLARNRRSEIRITLARYRRILESLR